MANPSIGTCRVVSLADYGESGGFAIEQFTHCNQPEPMWCIPAWVERGLGNLAGPFTTREQAEAALAEDF